MHPSRTNAAEPPAPSASSRRRFLALAAAGLALVATGTGVLRGVRTSSAPPPKVPLRILTPWQYLLVQHLARRIAAPDREDPAIPTPDDADVAGFVDAYVEGMPAPLRRDLVQGFLFVEQLAPLMSGHTARFTDLAPAQQDEVLAALEASRYELLRGAFAGLKALVFMGYYRDPRTWRLLGYDGPFVGRPAAGWAP